jgi:FdhD protein
MVDALSKAASGASGASGSAAVATAQVERLTDDAARSAPQPDRIAVEAPLEIRFGGKSATVLMRTPGDDEELVRGFLFSEGIIGRAADVMALRRPPDLTGDEAGNVLIVDLVPSLARAPLERSFYSSASCGVCGKTSIASLAIRVQPTASRLTVKREVLGGLPDKMRASQAAFRETGGVHASGLFTADGTLITLREDVGRHNALDKLIGWALGAGRIPLADSVLLVSGRVAYEIVQKAIVAGLPVLAAVGAPSSLAAQLAERFHVTLVGFLRPDTMNVYAHGERIVD